MQPAGAGRCRFGKTRALVHRIAWLMQVERCSPFSIIAVTFTNKAAAEMRGRVEKVIGDGVRGMWIGTFHGIAHRLLRAHHLDAGLPQDFQIRLRRPVPPHSPGAQGAQPRREALGSARREMGYINGKKDEGLRPGDIDLYGDPVTRTYQQIPTRPIRRPAYRSGAWLILPSSPRAHELWLDKPQIP
ncbi:UvrD-helicase domain-containing protein [Escherichia coli]